MTVCERKFLTELFRCAIIRTRVPIIKNLERSLTVSNNLVLDAIILPMLLTVCRLNRQKAHRFKLDYLYEKWFDDLISIIQADLLNTKKKMYQEAKIKVDKIEQTTEIVTYKVRTPTKEEHLSFTPVELKDLTEKYLQYYLYKGDEKSNEQTI